MPNRLCLADFTTKRPDTYLIRDIHWLTAELARRGRGQQQGSKKRQVAGGQEAGGIDRGKGRGTGQGQGQRETKGQRQGQGRKEQRSRDRGIRRQGHRDRDGEAGGREEKGERQDKAHKLDVTCLHSTPSMRPPTTKSLSDFLVISSLPRFSLILAALSSRSLTATVAEGVVFIVDRMVMQVVASTMRLEILRAAAFVVVDNCISSSYETIALPYIS